MRILGIILISVFVVTGYAQLPSRSDLEKERQQILESIKETQELLATTKNDQKATLSQLRALQAKLNARQKLIATYSKEINHIDNNIQNSSGEVQQLQHTLEVQKARYAASIRYAYKNRNSYDMLAFIFSSSDFNDAIRRMKYLKKYRDYRKEQVGQIKVTQYQIENKIGVLNNQKTEKNQLLNTEEEQKQQLQKETDETNEVVTQLKGREKELSAQIDKNRKTARQLDQQISKVIQREIELARKRAEEEERKRQEEQHKAELAAQQNASSYGNVSLNTGSGARPTNIVPSKPGSNTKPANNPPSNANATANNSLPPREVNREKLAAEAYRMGLTPEVAALSNSFEANRGRLPWPVEKGFISLGFGTYRNPLEPKVVQENLGVSITTSPNAIARAVFDGTVSSAFYLNGAGWTIVINHGQFFTVYSGLENASVNKNTTVHTKQPIGTVGLNDEGVPVINFQIWKSKQKLDPATWIAQ